MQWHYKQPVEIIFGKGTFKELKNLLQKFKNPLLVADPFFVKSKYSESIRELGINNIFYNFSSNPDVLQVNECSGIIRKNKTDVIIAVGGGSAIDLAKAASLGLEDITDYHKGNAHIPIEHVPVIAVPTSVGYGASFGGVSALLSMLNSCASGVSVVNIDNGFGAAYTASMINHRGGKQ